MHKLDWLSLLYGGSSLEPAYFDGNVPSDFRGNWLLCYNSRMALLANIDKERAASGLVDIKGNGIFARKLAKRLPIAYGGIRKLPKEFLFDLKWMRAYSETLLDLGYMGTFTIVPEQWITAVEGLIDSDYIHISVGVMETSDPDDTESVPVFILQSADSERIAIISAFEQDCWQMAWISKKIWNAVYKVELHEFYADHKITYADYLELKALPLPSDTLSATEWLEAKHQVKETAAATLQQWRESRQK